MAVDQRQPWQLSRRRRRQQTGKWWWTKRGADGGCQGGGGGSRPEEVLATSVKTGEAVCRKMVFYQKRHQRWLSSRRYQQTGRLARRGRKRWQAER